MIEQDQLVDLVRRLNALEVWQERFLLPESGPIPVFLTTPYINTAFDGDSFSDVGSNTKIENTSWSTTIPADAVALLIRCYCRDSASSSTSGLFFALFPASGATDAALAVRPSGKANDDFADQQGIVPCVDGDIWYQCEASGTDTLDVVLEVWGYWLLR